MKKILSLIAILAVMPIFSATTAHAETIYHYGDGTSGTTPLALHLQHQHRLR